MSLLTAHPLLPRLLLLGACLSLPGAGRAQTAPVAQVVLKPLPATEGPVPASAVAEPQVLHQVTEDTQVRIEETRVRGQTQRITVQPKLPGLPAYEIVPQQAGRSATQDARAGQRVWLDLSF
jgi:hypothetical protein